VNKRLCQLARAIEQEHRAATGLAELLSSVPPTLAEMLIVAKASAGWRLAGLNEGNLSFGPLQAQ